MKSAVWTYVSLATLTLTLGIVGGCGSDDEEETTVNACAGVDCGSRGACNARTGACDCQPGYSGSACDECATDYHPEGSACVPDQCAWSAMCDDGIACNGLEICAGGTCHGVAPVSCGEHGSCQEPTGVCACEPGYHVEGVGCLPDQCSTAADCNDGLVCTGEESCVANTCKAGIPVSCGSHGTCQEPSGTCDCEVGYHLDGNLCLKDACETAADCNDGLVCNGGEACTGGVCEAGTPVSCLETEVCQEPGGTCECAPGYVDDEGTCVEVLEIIGSYVDDWTSVHVITQTEWTMDESVFVISQYDNAEDFLVAQNHADNAYNPALWSRFDWTYDGTDLYYCQIAYDAADEATAAANVTADRTDLEAGCATFGWSKLTAE